MRIRIGLAVLLIAAILFAVFYGASAFLSPSLSLKKERGLEGYGILEVRAWPEGDAFLLGNSISYFIEVKYNTQAIEGIDKTSIDKNLVFEPFEIRSMKEREFNIDSRTRVLLREYKIQLISGEPGESYFFPPVMLRYKVKNSAYFDKKLTLQPIPVGSRFPAGIEGIELKPIEGKVANKSRQLLPFMIIGLGIFCGVWVVTEILRKVSRRSKAAKDFRKKLADIEDIFKAYQVLLEKEGEPKAVLHQAHQILRELLSKKEGIAISPITQQRIGRVFSVASKAYSQEVLCEAELQEALQILGKIFDFYIGRGEG